jgi:hypothetical protein
MVRVALADDGPLGFAGDNDCDGGAFMYVDVRLQASLWSSGQRLPGTSMLGRRTFNSDACPSIQDQSQSISVINISEIAHYI